ncbi:Protein phosphatase 1E [Trichinella papuae]|uniref:Protein phosphatase 1E n=1 Tax=Trichinella papuae TaxID=268474 RepID=A0A0V1MRY7_9BILA|nr:Protein phosphatase 1E [Trichinella papuae]KRZ74142.1 Protein phosphatase 1E [Trichinella papuae]
MSEQFSVKLQKFLDDFDSQSDISVSDAVHQRVATKDKVTTEEIPAEVIARNVEFLTQHGFNNSDALWLSSKAFHSHICNVLLSSCGDDDDDDEVGSMVETFQSGEKFIQSSTLNRLAVNELVSFCQTYFKDIVHAHSSIKLVGQIPSYSVLSVRNRRRKMEDRFCIVSDFRLLQIPEKQSLLNSAISLFAIFDGHGGPECALYVSKHLAYNLCNSTSFPSNLRESTLEAYERTERNLLAKCHRENIKSGTTCLACVVDNESIHISWLGDSMVAMLNRFGEMKLLNHKHSPSNMDEWRLIKDNGGAIIEVQGESRVNGWINVTRSFGDYHLKPPLLSLPQYVRFARCSSQSLLVMASDGFWDGMDICKCRELVLSFYAERRDKGEDLADYLLNYSITEGGSSDNVTLIIVYLLEREELADSLRSVKISC